ncbi:hypothetical protein KH5H1_61830 [Corallococcus caeni]|uniref:Uncharacterized protein n=2 Tax=Corallococcus TaxID=83461 RepID=A0A7Y4NIH3_9BACT|nr:hypothetical protein [Corallococcus exercitus]NOK15129.1 hypothetical protein [Corallococcus exercitus]GMU02063.1 hypothetical protein KH5H1_61830 [Corallococcus sp. KH5-1]GMU10400.1 hypothetical protein ASNO1_66540 [Corallococcus sp. NO1]
MGLAERKEMAAFKKDYLAPKVAELKEAAGGADIQVTLDEASFTSVAAIQMISNGFFDRLIDDMKYICNDDVGKEAVRDGVKVVQVSHKEDPGYTLDLSGGTLTLRAKLDGSIGEDLPGYGAYKDLMLKKL